MKIKIITRRWWAGLFLLLAGAAAHAAQVTLDGTRATGITGLDLFGTGSLFDAEFIRVTDGSDPAVNPLTLLSPCNDPDAVAGVACDLFVDFNDLATGDQTGAETAVDAVNAALNASSAVTVGPALPSTFTRTVFVVPFETCDITGQGQPDPGICAISGFNTSGVVGAWARIPNSTTEIFLGGNSDLVYARFTPASAVPLPPAVVLFVTGLTLLLARAKRGGPAA